MADRSDLPVTIFGAAPFNLSVAAHLRSCGYTACAAPATVLILKIGRYAIHHGQLASSEAWEGWAYPHTRLQRIIWTPTGISRYLTGSFVWNAGDLPKQKMLDALGEDRQRALLLYTGQRRGDVVGMGRQHVRRHIGEDGIAREMISVRQEKTGAALDIPLHPDLAAIIAATPSEHLTYLTTQFGKPFTSAGFGNFFSGAM
jgi:hypothetical protein